MRKLRNSNSRYLFQNGNVLELRELNAETWFAFDLFDSLAINNLNISELKNNIGTVLEQTDEESAELLRMRYGLDGREQQSFLKLEKLLGAKYNTIRARTKRILNELRQYGSALLKYDETMLDETQTRNEIDMILADDLRNYLHQKETVFLQTIFDRRQIKVEFQTEVRKKFLPEIKSRFSLLDAGIVELRLSSRTLEELRKQNLMKISQILMQKKLEELISEKAYQETINKIERFRQDMNTPTETANFYTAVKIILTEQQDTRETELYFDGNAVSENLILNKFYELLCYRERNGSNLFETEMSVRLKNLLLMKGYFYLTDVFSDGEKLMNEFERRNMTEFLEDLEHLMQAGTAAVIRVNDQTIKFLEFYHIDRVSELRGINPASLEKEERIIQRQLIQWCNANILYHTNEAYHGNISAIIESGGTEDDRQGTPSAQTD